MFWRPSFNPETDIPALSGKVFLVTGGNAGLGKETCLQLAKHNPSKIFLAARTQSKAEETITVIKSAVPEVNIQFLKLDLTSLKSVKAAADEVYASADRLDVLINNAGIMAALPGTTQEGYEIQFGTNHVGHALLTKQLLPLLEKTARSPSPDVRIINLSSDGHQLAPRGGIVFDDKGTLTSEMADYSTWTRYGQSKLANVLYAKELASRYPAIKSVSLHPGVVDTGLAGPFVKDHPWLGALFNRLVLIFAKSVEQGTLNQLWAATSKVAESGKYYVPVGKENAGSASARDEKLRERLWEWTEEELKRHGY